MSLTCSSPVTLAPIMKAQVSRCAQVMKGGVRCCNGVCSKMTVWMSLSLLLLPPFSPPRPSLLTKLYLYPPYFSHLYISSSSFHHLPFPCFHRLHFHSHSLLIVLLILITLVYSLLFIVRHISFLFSFSSLSCPRSRARHSSRLQYSHPIHPPPLPPPFHLFFQTLVPITSFSPM